MKKTVMLMVAILVSVCAMAQTKQHMKFMGIPMGVSITTFQQKLIAKGLKYDKETSDYIGPGSRLFDGVFAGYKATIHVYYDTKDNNVYRAKAVIRRDYLEGAEQVYSDISLMLLKKYPNGYYSDNSDINPYKANSLYTDLGRIDCFISKLDGDMTNSYKDRISVHVDYWDSKSQDQHESNRMDDL